MMTGLSRLLIAALALMAGGSTGRAEVRIKDITSVEGARGNQLSGFGLVVGLHKTGSTMLATQQMAIDALRKKEVATTIARQSLLDNVFKSQNISMVLVTAELPEFARKGSKLDVVVSAFDDASSLEGGTLWLTPLEGADREVYAVAQGPVSIGGARVRGAGNGQLNHPTVGRIQGGAFVEREALGAINQNGVVRLLLLDHDYATSTKISQAINERFPGSAKSEDKGAVLIRIPAAFTRRVTEFVSEVGLLSVSPDTTAKVIINERTGTVILGHNVRVSGIGITHRNLVISPNMSAVPRPLAGGSASPLPNPPSLLSPPKEEDERFGPLPVPPGPDDKPQSLRPTDQTYTVAELARVLNALGATPQDLISIFESLKDSGALHAELLIK